MTDLTIAFPDALLVEVEREAKDQFRPVDQMVVVLLADGLGMDLADLHEEPTRAAPKPRKVQKPQRSKAIARLEELAGWPEYRAILCEIYKDPTITSLELKGKTGISMSVIYSRIGHLKSMGLIWASEDRVTMGDGHHKMWNISEKYADDVKALCDEED